MEYDLVIIGGGPAGLTAGLYGVRAKLKTLLLEKLPLPGGQILNAWKVENYPGFPEGITGQELVAKMETQAREFGLEMRTGEVTAIQGNGAVHQITVEERIQDILSLLDRERRSVAFHRLFPEMSTRRFIVVTFLAVLELVKMKMIRVFQMAPFETIRISPP